MFEELAEHLINLREDTSADAISFLPSRLGDVRTALTSLADQMPEWDIEILEHSFSKTVYFGESLEVNVQDKHWNMFLDLFDNRDLKKGIISQTSDICESTDLAKELKPQLIKTFTEAPFDECQYDLNLWKTRFGIDEYKHQDVLISYQNKKNDMRKLYNSLRKIYGADNSDLQVLLEALRGKTSLASFQTFDDHKFLYGARLFSRFRGVKMIFESTVDPEFNLSESVYVDDPDLADVLEEQPRGYKVVGQLIYPKGQRFKSSFYKLLQDTV